MLVDLHVHTALSSDSRTNAEDYLEAIARSGRHIDALCLTEHRLFPTDGELDRHYEQLALRYGVKVFKGVEADTDLGHLLLFGLTPALISRHDLTSRLLRSETLIVELYKEGGIAIPAHPFRDSGFGTRLRELKARLGDALCAIEAINGQNSEAENRAAIEAAESLGLGMLAGSDAHFPTPKWFLTCATEFEREVGTVEELCAEIRAGRGRATML